MTTATYTTTSIVMLTLGPCRRVDVDAWPEPETYHSDDAYQLAAWLRQGKGPTCPNDVALVDMVQTLIDEG